MKLFTIRTMLYMSLLPRGFVWTILTRTLQTGARRCGWGSWPVCLSRRRCGRWWCVCVTMGSPSKWSNGLSLTCNGWVYRHDIHWRFNLSVFLYSILRATVLAVVVFCALIERHLDSSVIPTCLPGIKGISDDPTNVKLLYSDVDVILRILLICRNEGLPAASWIAVRTAKSAASLLKVILPFIQLTQPVYGLTSVIRLVSFT